MRRCREFSQWDFAEPPFFHSFLSRRGWGWKTHWVCFFFAWPQRAADTGPGRLGGAAFRRVRAPVGCDGRRLQTGGAKTRAKQTPSRTTKPRVFSPWPEKELNAHFSLCLLNFLQQYSAGFLLAQRGAQRHTQPVRGRIQGARPASTPEFGFRQSFQVVFSHLWWPSPWNETISDPAATRGFRQGRGCQTVVSGNFD